MGVVPNSEVMVGGFDPVLPEVEAAPEPESPSLGAAFWTGIIDRNDNKPDDVFEADFWRNNTVGSTIRFFEEWNRRMDTPEVPGYDALGDIQGYERFAGAFVDSRSPAETAIIKQRIDYNQEAERTLAASGWKGLVSGLLNGLVDPTTYIPVIGWEVRGASLGTRLASGVSRGAIGGFEAGVASEVVLQATQPDREISESANNVLAYTVLGGLFGGALGFMTKGQMAEVADAMQRDFSPPRMQAGGAMAADVRTPEGLTPETSGLGWFMRNRVTGDPVGRGTRSSFFGIQKATVDLADTAEHLRTEGSGVPVTEGGSAEARTKAWYGLAGRADEAVHQQYRAYRDRVRAEGGRPMNKEDFSNAVTRATHREGGIGLLEADAAAAEIRARFYDPAFEAGQEVGLLSKNLVAPGDYGHRVWNHDKIATDNRGLAAKIEEHIRGLRGSNFLANLRDKVDRLNKTIEAKVEEIRLLTIGKDAADEKIAKASKAMLRAEKVRLAQMRSEHALLENRMNELEAISEASDDAISRFTDEAINHIQLGSFGRGLASSELRGGFKFRLLDFIPNSELEPWLDMNISHVLGHYIHFVAPDIEIARKFGSPSMEDVIKAIEEDGRAQIRQAPVKEQPSLDKELKYGIEELKNLRDVQRNIFALPKTPTGSRSLRFLLNTGILRAGGQFLLSSVPDIARPATIFGMKRFFGPSLDLLLKGLQSPEMKAALSNITSDLRDMGAANELLRNERMLSFANAFVDYSHMSKGERAVQWLTDRYGKVTGMSYWNQYWKRVSGLLSVNRTLADVARLAKNGKLDEKSQRRLDFLGISPQLAIQIAEQFGKHGETVGRLKNANWSEWTNTAAKQAFQAAVVKDVERTILTPGLARPLWMSTPVGRLVGQFRSFTATSMSKIVVASLQERDAAQLAGLVFNVILGGMVFITKKALQGAAGLAAIDAMTGEEFLTNAVDQSGLGGWFFELNNVAQKFSGRSIPNWAHLAVGDDQGQAPITRYQAYQSVLGLLGPTARAAEDVRVGTSGLLTALTGDEEVNVRDIQRLKRNLVPYQNLWWLRVMLDQVENATGENLEVLR